MRRKTPRIILSIMLAFTMVLSGLAMPASLQWGTQKAYAAPYEMASSWSDLESKIGEATPGDIIMITADLYADKTITITKEITIIGSVKSGGELTQIYQKIGSEGKYQTMFNVGDGGDLTLGNDLILSGKTCKAGGGGGGGSQTAFLNSAKGFLANTSVNDVRTSTDIGEAHRTIELEVKTVQNSMGEDIQRGFVKIKGKYIKSESSGSLVLTDTFDENQATFITTTGGGDVTSLSENGKYFLYTPCSDSNYNGYIYYNDTYYQIVSGGGNTDAMEWTAQNVATSGGGGGQTCDGADCATVNIEDPKNDTYTQTTFPGGSVSQPKGFFVQVEGGGKATLNGAILENFNTTRDKDTTPNSVAPVAVKGAGSTFNVEGGEIRNNIVGYIVNDEKAYESADDIKFYIKGAAPNAQRKPKSLRRNRQADIDDGNPGSGITATAGAVLYGDGTKGTISGGSIKYNRGDTGGIMATGSNTLVTLTTGTDINNNVGVQFGGGVTTEDDAAIVMSGGTISKNVAWFGGGGVYATENGVEWLKGDITDKNDRKDGKFRMDGGVIENNTAFTRGGGFFVDSDGVTLIKGVIRGNMSRMLGGGMYVMGDHPDFTYNVYINHGYVHENRAVSSGSKERSYVATDSDNQILSRKLVAPPDSCDTTMTDLFSGQMTKNSDDMKDGYPREGSDGTGGGIWLCSYGNTVLNVGKDSEGKETFIIDKNSATGSIMPNCESSKEDKVRDATSSDTGKSGGNDIHKETKGPGNIVIYPVTKEDPVNWYDEVTGKLYTDPANAVNYSITDYSLKNLTNKGTSTPEGYNPDKPENYNGVNVYGNLSRRGGGLAANGTFLFGNTKGLGEAYSELAVTKTWAGGVEPEDVTIRINLEYKEDGKEKTIQVIELPLSEIDFTEQASELDTVFTEGSKLDDKNRTVYLGHIVLPITVDDENGKKIQLFDLVSEEEKVTFDGETISEGETFLLNTADGLYRLGRYLKAGGTVILSNAERKLTFVELVKDPSTGELVPTEGYEITPTEMRLSTSPAPNIQEHDVIQVGIDGKPTVVGTIITSDVRFEADLVNDKPAEIVKYVNKAVHKDIKLDEEFEYDIIAYVKHGTDKIVIEDQLVDDLEFVSKEGDVQVVSLDKNNNEPKNNIYGELVNSDASVAQTGDAITNKKVEINNNKLTVSVENELDEVIDAKGNVIGYKNAPAGQDLTALWGKWVKVTYKARIKKDLQEKIKAGKMKVSDLESVTIKDSEKYKADPSIFDKEDRPTPNVGNDPVKSDEDHKGIANTASYSLEVKNEPAFRDESNTVTVKPEQPELEKYVNQAVHKDISCDEVFTYDIIGYITKDADKVIFEDQLVDDLEFADDPEVKVVSIDKNNHKPKNNINGEEVNKDASVAEAGTPVPEDGLTIETSKDGKLTVTIDDGVKVNDSTGAVERLRSTVKNLRGKYVKVTFKAQIKKSIQEEIKNKTKSIADLSSVTVKGTENDPVLSDEAHNGIVNEASMKIEVGNKGKYDIKSNKVTAKPEQPEIEKYVNQAVHDFIDIDEIFTYDIIAYVTKDADKVVVTDKLHSQLQFVSEDSEIKVVDLGTTNNHKVTNDTNAKQVNKDASVAEAGKTIEKKKVSISGDTLTVTLDDPSTVKALRGHWVKITFDSKIKDGLTINDLQYTKINASAAEDRAEPNKGNAPVLSDESHEGVPNKASYIIGVTNEAGKIEDKYNDESNTVTVKPENPKPSFNKTVNGGKALEITDRNEIFIYTLTANIDYVPEKSFVITDDIPEKIEMLGPEAIGIIVNGEELSDELIKEITTVEGNLLTVEPTLEMMEEWGPFEMIVDFACKFKDDAEIKSGEAIKNVAMLEVDGEEFFYDDGEDEAEVKGVFDEKQPTVVKPENKPTKAADTGDQTSFFIWVALIVLAAVATAAFAIRRRKELR